MTRDVQKRVINRYYSRIEVNGFTTPDLGILPYGNNAEIGDVGDAVAGEPG